LKSFIHIGLVIAPLLTGCLSSSKTVNLSECGIPVPEEVPGLKITGPRTRASIIHDMASISCAINFLIKNDSTAMLLRSANNKVVIKVIVEYTGEVIETAIIESNIDHQPLVQKIEEIIMNSDFTFWGHNQQETEFIYPLFLLHKTTATPQ
jgi:hypothetical protein